MSFTVKKKLLYISHKANDKSTIVKRHLNNILKLKKAVSVKDPDTYSNSNISASQDFEPMLLQL